MLNKNIKKSDGWKDIKNLEKNEIGEAYAKYAKRANTRLTNLEKHNMKGFVYETATKYNTASGRNTGRFYGGKNPTKRDILEVIGFLESKTSTISGMREMNTKRQATFTAKYNLTKEQYKQFEKFLEYGLSNEISKMYDSNQQMETVATMVKEGYKPNEINKAFKAFLNKEIKADEVKNYMETDRQRKANQAKQKRNIKGHKRVKQNKKKRKGGQH